jgi:preprotein translocase subunit SecE
MAVGTKKMANAAAASDSSLGNTIRSWPERIKSFYNDVRTEMRKVTTPSRKEVQSTTIVVIIAVFIFGVYFLVVDTVISKGYDLLLHAVSK